MLYVAEGCAHGYLSLTDGAEIRYLTSQFYAPDAATGVRYDDPALGIDWPAEVRLVSDRRSGMATPRAGLGRELAVIILDQALAQRAADGNPVRIALVGAGYMGRGIAVEIAAIDPGSSSSRSQTGRSSVPRRPRENWAEGRSTRVSNCRGAAGRHRPPSARRRPRMRRSCARPRGSMSSGGDGRGRVRRACCDLDAIAHGKHVVLVNAELDATVGPVLKAVARRGRGGDHEHGRRRAGRDDEPPPLRATIGFKPVLAGNIKGFIDPHRNPRPRPRSPSPSGREPKMITSFADGTKLSMEATIVANATGFGVARRG